MKREKTHLVIAVGIFLGIAAAHAADSVPGAPSLDAYNEDVAACRRVIRQSCAILQGMVRDGGSAEQQAEALEFLLEARAQYDAIREEYTDNPPAEFTPANVFRMRLDDIANAMDDMERALRNGEARRSFRACGFACGLFVTLHEGYGLDYALDKLFHLRKDIRTAQTVMNTRGIDAVRASLPELLNKRNAVLLAPPPFTPDDARFQDYWAAVDELSTAVDGLALAFAQDNTSQAQTILMDLLRAVNKPYGIAL